ncbi:MAG TPA: formimidoylglutamate deiminase [Bryobacteraceae bacterium]|nr:formimidoylglutamate deiminase [Bryobacteraceae bacterium]
MRYAVNVVAETGWLPDLIYVDGRFETGLAMMADRNGRIARFSREPANLNAAIKLTHRAALPGLVNVHSHAFQRAIRGRTEHKTTAHRDTFWTWRVSMYHAANRIGPEAMYAIARMAFLEMMLTGITTVGEFHYLHHDARGAPYGVRNLLALEMVRAANEVGLRLALLRSAYVRAGWNRPPDPLQARFITPLAADFIADTEALRAAVHSDLAWVGVAPHSVRAAPLDYLREVAKYARAADLPLHMHVAEQPAEVEACVAEYGRRPVELLHDEGILDSRFTGIHAIHVTGNEMRFLGKSHVCACPTSERNLGDGAVPADGLYNAGAGICFGTDSNIQIDLLEDARLLEYDLRMNKLARAVLADSPSRDALARRLFHSATATGAASLGAPGGALEPGRPADFFTVDLNDPSIAGADADSLLNQVVFALERTAVKEVCVDGKMIVRDGRHPLEEQIVSRFAEVQRDLWP